MGACAVIQKNLIFDCDNPIISGADDRLIIGNRADISSVTKNGSNPKIFEAITLNSGANLFYYEGKNLSVEPRYALRKRAYSEGYEHEVRFKAFKATPELKDELEAMAQGDLFAIVENKYRAANGNGAFEIYGYDTGLQLMELERIIKEAETQGAFNLQLRTHDDVDEPHMPYTFFKTDYATTKALIDALIASSASNI